MRQNNNTGKGEKITIHVEITIAKLIPKFLKNMQNNITAIQKALRQSDFETIQTLGHNMKGSGGSIGFDTVSDIGKSLEQAAKNQNSEEIMKQIDILSTYLERVEIVYE